MKKIKFGDGSFIILAIKSDLFDQEADGIFDADGNLLMARIRFPSGLARSVPRHGKVWKEIQAAGEIRTAKRKARIPRPKAVRKQPARKKYPPFEKPRRGRRISRREQFSHDFREEQKAIAARIRGEVYVPKPYPEPSKPMSGIYRSFGAWASAVRRAGGVVRSQLSEPQLAYNRSGEMVGEWDGQSGMIIS